jgi:hypothetical protein
VAVSRQSLQGKPEQTLTTLSEKDTNDCQTAGSGETERWRNSEGFGSISGEAKEGTTATSCGGRRMHVEYSNIISVALIELLDLVVTPILVVVFIVRL